MLKISEISADCMIAVLAASRAEMVLAEAIRSRAPRMCHIESELSFGYRVEMGKGGISEPGAIQRCASIQYRLMHLDVGRE